MPLIFFPASLQNFTLSRLHSHDVLTNKPFFACLEQVFLLDDDQRCHNARAASGNYVLLRLQNFCFLTEELEAGQGRARVGEQQQQQGQLANLEKNNRN